MKSVAPFAALLGAAAATQGYGYGSNWNSTTSVAPITPPGYEPSVTAIVSSFTTVCPTPTTLTYNSKTYTITESTTLTISECPCTITTPIKSYPESTVTAILTSFETYCPSPTTVTYNGKPFTVTEATTLTVTDVGECTVTTPIGSIPSKPTPTWSYQKPSSTPETSAKPSTYVPKPSVYSPTWNATTPPSYTTEVVSSYTTYCPYPTTFTHGTSTYTVTKPTTVTITECPCTITKPVTPTSYYTTEEKTTLTTYCPTSGVYTIGTTTTTVERPTTLTYTQYLTKPATTETAKPSTVYTSELTTLYVTYCPSATTIVMSGTSYPVQGPTTVSIPIVQTSIYTKPAPPATYQPAPSSPEQPAPPATTAPASPEQPPATTGRVVTQISDGQIQAPTSPAESSPVEAQPTQASASASASPSIQPYTGGAGKMASSGAGAIALVAGAFFF